MKASGTSGELRVSYQRAVTLGSWSLETGLSLPLAFVIEAQVKTLDAFWSTQTPMVIDLQFGRFHWIWDDIKPVYENGSVSVRVVGKPQIMKE